MKYYLVILLIIILKSQLLYGQDKLNNFVNSINQLSEWTYENDADIDNLVFSTGNKLIEILKSQKIENPDNLGIDCISSKDSIISVYTFSYNSGGTRGTIHNPVIQWKKKDGSLGAYELYPANKKKFRGVEFSISEIYKLPSNNKKLYLLIGSEKGSSIMYNAYAIVIQIKNNYLILDYPAFLNKSSGLKFNDYLEETIYDIACIDFDENKKELIIEDLGKKDKVSLFDGSEIDVKKEKTLKLIYDENKSVFKKSFYNNKK